MLCRTCMTPHEMLQKGGVEGTTSGDHEMNITSDGRP